MAKKITLVRRAIKPRPDTIPSYVLQLEVTTGENITKYIFVKQRFKVALSSDQFEDKFAAVATPIQLEDLDESIPAAGTSFFRDLKVTLYGENEAYLDKVFDTILADIQTLITNAEELEVLEEQGTYVVLSTGITETNP